MDLYTKNCISRIRNGESGLDSEKFAVRHIALLAQNICEVSEQVAADLSHSNREAAHRDLIHIQQRIVALQNAIGFPTAPANS